MKSALLLSLTGLAANVQAHPQPRTDNELTNHGNLDLSKYYLTTASTYTSSQEIQANSIAASMAKRGTYVETATQFVKKVVPGAEFRLIGDHYTGSNGISHANFKQTLHGIDIDNANFNVNIGRDGSIFSFGNGFYTGNTPSKDLLAKRTFKQPTAALKSAIDTLGLPIQHGSAEAVPQDVAEHYSFTNTVGAASDPTARLVYIVKQDGSLALTWAVETDVTDKWLVTYMDAESSSAIHAAVNHISDFASMEVFPWNLNDPSEGDRQVLKDPWLESSSPFTWFGDGSKNYTTLSGNNAISGTSSGYRPESKSRQFEYPWSSDSDPANITDASITQAFYTVNKFHDVFYSLGFTEAAGNFQTNNNGKGGKGNDSVNIIVQSPSSTNNAGFGAAEDGKPGRLSVGTFTYTKPNRDGVFDSDILIHECGHGVSKRMTGGPGSANCLEGLEAGGMGEGWSDFMALAVHTPTTHTRSTNVNFGHWVLGKNETIRDYPYSTSMETNPLTYAFVDERPQLYTMGTMWASTLYEVMWNIIDKHGNSDDDYPTFDDDGVPSDGRFLTLKLVVDALALQPCGPNAIQARNAILDADKALTGGVNKCEIWEGFSKRGLGSKAAYTSKKRTEDFTLPRGC